MIVHTEGSTIKHNCKLSSTRVHLKSRVFSTINCCLISRKTSATEVPQSTRSVTKPLTSASCSDAFLLFRLWFERAKMNWNELNPSENELCGHKILLFPDTIGYALTRLGQGYFSTWQMFVENFTVLRISKSIISELHSQRLRTTEYHIVYLYVFRKYLISW